MIKPKNLQDELFVVILPGGNVLEMANKIQSRLSRKYNLYKEGFYPQIHITIDKIKIGTSKKAGELIKDIVEQYTSVNIIVEDFNCFHFVENRFLMLDVIPDKSLESLAQEIHNRLQASKLSIIHNYNEWDFHITIINDLFSQHPLSEKEFNEICTIFQDRRSPCISPAESVEIWRPTLDPAKKCLYKISFDK